MQTLRGSHNDSRDWLPDTVWDTWLVVLAPGLCLIQPSITVDIWEPNSKWELTLTSSASQITIIKAAPFRNSCVCSFLNVYIQIKVLPGNLPTIYLLPQSHLCLQCFLNSSFGITFTAFIFLMVVRLTTMTIKYITQCNHPQLYLSLELFHHLKLKCYTH